MKSPKYITVTISSVVTSVALRTDIEGYSVSVIQTALPSEDEMQYWSEAMHDSWIKENNDRMYAICEFLNEKNL